MKPEQTLLLVDDSDNDLQLMRAAFKKAPLKLRLQEVCNGEQAIAYLKGAAPYSDRSQFPLPALILTDLNMPLNNGFDMLTWVRAQPGLKRIPIVILTASMRTEDVDRAFDLGANAFLVKPSTLDELTAMACCLRDWIQINQFPSLDP